MIETGYISKPLKEPRVIINGDCLVYYNEFGVKSVVKRCKYDEVDYEKALLYAVAKSAGVTPRMIAKLLDKAHYVEHK
jgi:hypothetical protein